MHFCLVQPTRDLSNGKIVNHMAVDCSIQMCSPVDRDIAEIAYPVVYIAAVHAMKDKKKQAIQRLIRTVCCIDGDR